MHRLEVPMPEALPLAMGTFIVYGGLGYICVQPHIAQTGWESPNVPALWRAE